MITNLRNLTIINPTYIACIMWKDQYGNVHRYKLWEGIGETGYLISVPLYSGQVILKNFRFEVWSLSGALTTEPLGTNIITSVLQGQDYRYAADGLLKGNDGIVINFSCPIIQSPNNYPVFASLQARWIGSTIVQGQPWLSSDGNNYNIQGANAATRSDIAVNNVANFNGTAQALFVNINPAHTFMLCYFPGNGNGVLYYYASIPESAFTGISGTQVSLTLEDGNSCLVPIERWVIIEIGYTGGNSFVRYFDLYNPVPYLPPTLTSTTTAPAPTAVLQIDGSGCPFYCADIEIFNQYLGEGASQQMLNYFYSQYNFNFPVPLVFPTNSSPQPNVL